MPDVTGQAREDERALWDAVWAGEFARDAGRRLGIHPKRVLYLCEKWAAMGVYEYGTSADLGWVDPRARESAGVRACGHPNHGASDHDCAPFRGEEAS